MTEWFKTEKLTKQQLRHVVPVWFKHFWATVKKLNMNSGRMTLYSPALLVLTHSDMVQYLLHKTENMVSGWSARWLHAGLQKKKHRHGSSPRAVARKSNILNQPIREIWFLTLQKQGLLGWGNHGSITLIGCLGVLASAKSPFNGELAGGSPSRFACVFRHLPVKFSPNLLSFATVLTKNELL